MCCGSSCHPYVGHDVDLLIDAVPRQLYLHVLLRLPALYYRRVARIFEDAQVSRPDITAHPSAPMTTGTRTLLSTPPTPTFLGDGNPRALSPALVRFKTLWEAFIESFLREWKTLNVISTLLLTCVTQTGNEFRVTDFLLVTIVLS
jgi:hypothetical protein